MSFPTARVGDIVLWHPHADAGADGFPAIVTKVGSETLMLNVADPNNHNFFLRDGVRHVTDKRAKTPELLEQGGWDHTPQTKEYIEFKKSYLDRVNQANKVDPNRKV